MVAERDDGSVVVELSFAGVQWLVREILKEAGDAAVLAPDAREPCARPSRACASLRRHARSGVATREPVSRRDQIKMSAARSRRSWQSSAPSRARRRPARLAARDAALVRAARRAAGEPGPRLWAWTYAASQKMRNLRRDARARSGRGGRAYDQLRGVMLECDARCTRHAASRRSGALFSRYAAPPGQPPRGLPPRSRR